MNIFYAFNSLVSNLVRSENTSKRSMNNTSYILGMSSTRYIYIISYIKMIEGKMNQKSSFSSFDLKAKINDHSANSHKRIT